MTYLRWFIPLSCPRVACCHLACIAQLLIFSEWIIVFVYVSLSDHLHLTLALEIQGFAH